MYADKCCRNGMLICMQNLCAKIVCCPKGAKLQQICGICKNRGEMLKNGVRKVTICTIWRYT